MTLDDYDAHFRAAHIVRGRALREALIALDDYLGAAPSDVDAHNARDALERFVADTFPSFMPWPIDQNSRPRRRREFIDAGEFA